MKSTPMATKMWEKIPKEFRMKILNNAWCGDCRGSVNINVEHMSVEQGMLKIEGRCMTCSGPVCRVVEDV